MRKLLLSSLMAFPLIVWGQAVRVDIPLLTVAPGSSGSSAGSLAQALWVSNATVIVCTHPSTLSSCTPATTYNDYTEDAVCPPSTPLVQLPGTACTASTGVAANVGFWYFGGVVDYWVTSSYGTFGPYTVSGSVGGGGGGGSGYAATVINIAAAPYNAVADGVTDNTTAIQNAITAACAAHTSIYVPGNANKFKFTKSLNATNVNGCTGFFITGDPGSGYRWTADASPITKAGS